MKKFTAFIKMLAVIIAGVLIFTVAAAAEGECPHKNWKWIVVEMEPTCTSNGFTDNVKWCKDCNTVIDIERHITSGPIDHEWSEWEDNSDGTVATRHCLNCDAMEEKPIEHEMTMFELGQTIRAFFETIKRILWFFFTGQQ